MDSKSPRRDKLGIMSEILQIAKEGTLKTQIMYKANLSFTQLNDYLLFMQNNNLITQTYSEGNIITIKGLDFFKFTANSPEC